MRALPSITLRYHCSTARGEEEKLHVRYANTKIETKKEEFCPTVDLRTIVPRLAEMAVTRDARIVYLLEKIKVLPALLSCMVTIGSRDMTDF